MGTRRRLICAEDGLYVMSNYKTIHKNVRYSRDKNSLEWNGLLLSWYSNGSPEEYCFLVRDVCHGEYIFYNDDGSVYDHAYYSMGEIIMKLKGMDVLSKEDKFALQLEHGAPWLPTMMTYEEHLAEYEGHAVSTSDL